MHDGVFGRGAHHVLRRGGPAHRLFDELRHQAVVGGYLAELVRILAHRPDRAGHRRRRGVVAGGYDEQIVADGFELTDRFAVDHGVADLTYHVVARSLASFLQQRGKMGLDALECGEQAPDVSCRIPARFDIMTRHFVLATKQFLQQVEQQRLVLLRSSKDFHDDSQWIAVGDVVAEVTGIALRRHAVDRSPREGTDALGERRDVLSQEPRRGDAAIQRMVRRIHLQQRANQMRAAARQRTRKFIRSGRQQRACTVAVAELLMAAADFDDVGMPGYRPERIEPFGLDASQPAIAAKPSEAGHQLLLSGIGLG